MTVRSTWPDMTTTWNDLRSGDRIQVFFSSTFWTLFGPYAPGRKGPRRNGPLRLISAVERCGTRETAQNPIQVLVLEVQVLSAAPSTIRSTVTKKYRYKVRLKNVHPVRFPVPFSVRLS
jgi:hypothetical protein